MPNIFISTLCDLSTVCHIILNLSCYANELRINGVLEVQAGLENCKDGLLTTYILHFMANSYYEESKKGICRFYCYQYFIRTQEYINYNFNTSQNQQIASNGEKEKGLNQTK